MAIDYESPQVTDLGAFADLTQKGTGVAQDSAESSGSAVKLKPLIQGVRRTEAGHGASIGAVSMAVRVGMQWQLRDGDLDWREVEGQLVALDLRRVTLPGGEPHRTSPLGRPRGGCYA